VIGCFRMLISSKMCDIARGTLYWRDIGGGYYAAMYSQPLTIR
jgi:hypothetical protein